jgi:hypothetical protein
MWPTSRAFNVVLKACLRLPVDLAGYRWRPSLLRLKLLTPAVAYFCRKNTRKNGWPEYMIYGVGWLDRQTCMEMAVAACQLAAVGQSWLAVCGCPPAIATSRPPSWGQTIKSPLPLFAAGSELKIAIEVTPLPACFECLLLSISPVLNIALDVALTW